MKTSFPRLLIVVILCVSASLAPADKVTLKNGRTLSGAMVSNSGGQMQFVTEMGMLRIDVSDVAKFVPEDTTPEELVGDKALAEKMYDKAVESYKAAQAKAGTSATAGPRLQAKLDQIRQTLKQSMGANIVSEIQQARQLMASKNFEGAIQMLQGILPKLPTDEATSAVRKMMAEAHFSEAEAARDSMNEIEMEKQLKDAIEVYEPYAKAHLVWGEMQLRSSATEKQGIEEIQRGLKYGEGELSDEDRVKYHYMIARRFFNNGDYENAAANYAEALRARVNNPAYADALDRAVESYIKMGERNVLSDFEKTINNLNEALKLNPNNKDAHFLLGKIYKDTGQTDKAIDELKMVTKLDPAYKESHHTLAQAYLDKKDYDNALKELNLELLNDPNSYDALADRAEVQILLGNWDKANSDLNQATTIEPSRWRAYLLTAQLAFSQEKYDEAQQNLIKVLNIKPDAIEAHIQMGKVLQAQKNYEPAKQWFNNVVDFLGKSKNLTFKYKNLMAEAQTALGSIDLFQDSPRQAETRFRQALDFMPDFAGALNSIGDVKRRLADEQADKAVKQDYFKQAESYYKKAIDADPRNPNYYLSLGILYHRNLKDTEKALVNYKKYLELGGRQKTDVEKWIEETGAKTGSGEFDSEGKTTAAQTMTTSTVHTKLTSNSAGLKSLENRTSATVTRKLDRETSSAEKVTTGV